MKRALLVILALTLFLSFAFLTHGDKVEAFPYTFRQKPITRGICEETAHTLNQGGLEVGEVSVPGSISQWKYAYLRYGLTDDLQVGTTLPQNFLGRPNLSVKYRLPFRGPGQGELAVPATIDLNLSPLGVSSHTGLTATWGNKDSLNFHTGVNLWLVSYAYRFFNPSAYVAADYDLLSQVKVMSEFNAHTFGEDFISARVGSLIRAFDFINLKLSSSVDLPSGGMNAWASLFVRF